MEVPTGRVTAGMASHYVEPLRGVHAQVETFTDFAPLYLSKFLPLAGAQHSSQPCPLQLPVFLVP